MKKARFIPSFLAASIVALSATSVLFSDSAKDYSIRFRSGRILAAELIQGEGPSTLVKNVDPYEPPSRITSDVAYAAIIVSLDPGRSLSIYDYSLKDANNRVYPCVALRENDGDFDASKWLYDNVPQSNRYTMLFRVQMPPPRSPLSYNLKFNLLGNTADVAVSFVSLKNRSFTNPSLFPDTGIIKAPKDKIKDFYTYIVTEKSE